ncbi:hypothetical protein CSE45_2553 [Citreicella sp. SE45]|nr:hypothetical protein CSE45_2553 [Citreicella sp. SE45]
MAENGVKISDNPTLASADYLLALNEGTSGLFTISDLGTLLAGGGVLVGTPTTNALSARITAVEDQAFAESPIYETTAAGIAATGEGDRFRVENADPAIAYDIYDHDAGGLATFLTDIPAGSALVTKPTISNALSEYAPQAATARANIAAAGVADLAETNARTGGIGQASGRGAPGVFDVNGVELLGFDAQGRAVFVVSPRVLEQIEASIGGPILEDLAEVGDQLAATEARTAGVAQGGAALPTLADALGRELMGFDRITFDAVMRGLRVPGFRLASAGPAGAPGLLARNAELLGFDAQGRLLAQPSEGFANRVAAVARQKPHLHDIACWGDSLTQGAFGEGTTYPDILAGALGVDVFNGGVGGTRSESIAMRQGGRPLFLTIAGNELPADTAEVLVTDFGTADIYNNQTAQTRSGTINGVRAVLTRYAVDGDPPSTDHYTLRRESAGLGPDPIPAGSRFVMDDALTYRDRTQIVWAGRNNIPRNRADLVSFRNDLLHTADWLAPRHGRHLVVSITSRGAAEGASGLADILEANRELREHFGDRFVDLQGYMSQRAIHDAGLTPTAQDETDMAGGFIPASLREPLGSSHFNPTGYTMIGAFMARQIRARGW